MTDQITLKEAQELVEFRKGCTGRWFVHAVKGDCSIVEGTCGTVGGTVFSTIHGRKWRYDETLTQKLSRLLDEGASKKQLLEFFNQPKYKR